MVRDAADSRAGDAQWGSACSHGGLPRLWCWGQWCCGAAATGMCFSPCSPQDCAGGGAQSRQLILDCFNSAVLQLEEKLLPQRKS